MKGQGEREKKKKKNITTAAS